ncbi:ORF_25 [Adoxophyes orana granulovirus]|uniref:ORF_25 n=1 Tax=Adoxophyes orana granulovirus TaxID=170617 RepID=Q7T9Z0_GVAO|nr:ORF_25 [Adoxophyes orana granulovirus]AAP85662.1 ORF_25 [Adoxophyes orana granulovirus]
MHGIGVDSQSIIVSFENEIFTSFSNLSLCKSLLRYSNVIAQKIIKTKIVLIMYLLRCEYDDLEKFNWTVLIDPDSLSLWLDVVCLRDRGYKICLINQPCKSNVESLTELNFNLDLKSKCICSEANELKSSDITTLFETNEFYSVENLKSATLDKCNDQYHTTLDQFLYYQLPYYIVQHLNNLKLISLFDIRDYWDMLLKTEIERKYWLFRLKMIEMFDEQKVNAESKRISAHNKELAKKIIDNVLCNVIYLHKIDNIDKLYYNLNFNSLLKSSVGLVEILLQWN